jgi:hypothetical protein
MKNLSLLLTLLLFLSVTAYSQVTNVTVNGQTSNFTMVSGGQLSWAYDVPNLGDSTLMEIWVDADSNGVLNPTVDVLWTYFVQIDGDTHGQNGPPDGDGLVDGHVIMQQPLGLAPAHYIMVFKNHNNYKYIAGKVTNLVSPAFTISGTVTVPTGMSNKNIMLSLQNNSQQGGTFWNALTDNYGHFSIQMSSDTSGNPWNLRTNNNIIFGSAIVSPDQYSINLNPNTSTYTGNNFTVTASSASVKGTVKDENGNPLINITAGVNGNNGNLNRYVQSDTIGAFQIGLLASELPLTYLSLYAGNQDDNSYIQAFYQIPSISSGNIITHNLCIFKINSSISGRITVDGNSPNFNVSLYGMNTDSAGIGTTSDLNGYFTFRVSNKIYNYDLSAYNIPNNYSSAHVTAHPGQTNVVMNISTTGVNKDNSNIPTAFSLSQNYPNPFNPSTSISYQLPSDAFVTLKIFNVLGNEVRTLTNGFTQAGSHQVQFNAQGLSSGVYFYTIQASSLNGKQSFRSTKKMILMK